MNGKFFLHKDVEFTKLDGGLKRKIVGHTDDLMVVYVSIDKKGAVGEIHSHDAHDQMGYVISGKFEITNDGVKKVLGTGDAFSAPKTVSHGVVCLEPGVILDVFSPKRDDFLS